MHSNKSSNMNNKSKAILAIIADIADCTYRYHDLPQRGILIIKIPPLYDSPLFRKKRYAWIHGTPVKEVRVGSRQLQRKPSDPSSQSPLKSKRRQADKTTQVSQAEGRRSPRRFQPTSTPNPADSIKPQNPAECRKTRDLPPERMPCSIASRILEERKSGA